MDDAFKVVDWRTGGSDPYLRLDETYSVEEIERELRSRG